VFNKICLALLVFFAIINTSLKVYEMTNVYTNQCRSVSVDLDKLTAVTKKDCVIILRFDNGSVYTVGAHELEFEDLVAQWADK
jgi:hypothetical protein